MSSSTEVIIVDKPLLSVGCTLGEAPLFDPATSILHFVDIVEKKVYHLNTTNLELSVDQYDEHVSCLALRRNGGGLACVAAKGFGLLDEASSLVYLAKPMPDRYVLHSRFNDGACDSRGRFFAGSMFSKAHDIPGELYRYDPEDGTCVVVDKGPFTDCNGLGWSPDEKIFYLTDSYTNTIYAYDYNDGELSNRRIFIDAIAQGLPEGTYADGLCIDSEGCVWSARWGGSRVVRFALDGTVDAEIVFPTALNVTACCFGGPNDDQLYVTTAHCGAVGGDSSRQNDFPDSGHLFSVNLAGRYRGGKWRHEFGA